MTGFRIAHSPEMRVCPKCQGEFVGTNGSHAEICPDCEPCSPLEWDHPRRIAEQQAREAARKDLETWGINVRRGLDLREKLVAAK